jgi:putative aminopeptidase FrvX
MREIDVVIGEKFVKAKILDERIGCGYKREVCDRQESY